MTAGAGTDLHAPMGKRELVVSLHAAEQQQATGARSFQLLFGPHNGSTRATLFAGYVPPGKAPWHYHLYDEIVFVPAGPGRLAPRRDGRGARRRRGLPATAAAGAHRREPERRRDDDHRGLHARRQPVCRLPRACDRRRVPLRRVAHGPLDPGRLERRAPAPRAGDSHLGRGSDRGGRAPRTGRPHQSGTGGRRRGVSSTPSLTTTRRCSRCTTSGSSTSCEPPGTDWDDAGLPGDPGQPDVVGYIFPTPGLLGGIEPRVPTALSARTGAWCFDTMTVVAQGTWEAARAAADAALTAADLVLGGAPAAYACCRPPGHHVTRSAFGGSCYLNNAAIAARHLRDRGVAASPSSTWTPTTATARKRSFASATTCSPRPCTSTRRGLVPSLPRVRRRDHVDEPQRHARSRVGRRRVARRRRPTRRGGARARERGARRRAGRRCSR